MRTRSESWPTGGSIRVVGVSEATICEMTHVTNLTVESRNEKEHTDRKIRQGRKYRLAGVFGDGSNHSENDFFPVFLYNSVCVWGEIPQVKWDVR